jgi:hypothetical protein
MEQEEITNWDSMTKGSTSPKKNERYSKLFQNDDEIWEDKMEEFQKALSMTLNFSSAIEPESWVIDRIGLDQLLSDTKIDEIDEDEKSVDDNSWSDSENSLSKNPPELKWKRNISEVKPKLSKKKTFFVHKANSFQKKCNYRSKSPVKSIIENIKSSSRKIKFMKMNSIAFKAQKESKDMEGYSSLSKKPSMSSIGESDSSHKKLLSSKNLERTIISPIRWEIGDAEEGRI